MTRFYTASFEAVAVTAGQDLFEINAPSDAIVRVWSAHIGQTSDAGDTQAEMLGIVIARANGSAGSGGGAATVTAHAEGDPAFGGTVNVNNTTQAGGAVNVRAGAFNVQTGWDYAPTPEEMLDVSPGRRLVIALNSAPLDSLTMSGWVTFEEIGG